MRLRAEIRGEHHDFTFNLMKDAESSFAASNTKNEERQRMTAGRLALNKNSANSVSTSVFSCNDDTMTTTL